MTSTLDWSAELDREARTGGARVSLKLDPALAAAFAEDDDEYADLPDTDAEYALCIDCDRTMRPARSRAADHPGTVQTGGRGRCQRCATHYRRLMGIRRPPTKSWGPCEGCGRLQRPSYVKAADYPDRTQAAGNGICQACWYRKRTGAKPRQFCPPACVECGRAMSPRSSRTPGTVAHQSHGRCEACDARHRYHQGKKR